jgi:hypothetical protein
VRFLLTPSRTENARRLPDDSGDLLAKNFVIMTIIIDTIDTNVCTQMDRVSDTTICPA